jgi:hypothetical protein
MAGFYFRLKNADGTPADPPTLQRAVPNRRARDTIPLGVVGDRVPPQGAKSEPFGQGLCDVCRAQGRRNDCLVRFRLVACQRKVESRTRPILLVRSGQYRLEGGRH